MYCAKCGVELADTETKCPLCGLRAFHPDLLREEEAAMYPGQKYPQGKRFSRLPQGLLCGVTVLSAVIVLLCDLQFSGAVTWSGYVMGALVTGYCALLLPFWFQKPNPVIFVPTGFAAIIGLLAYINLATGGDWFMSFAFPVAGFMGVLVSVVVTLMRYLRKGFLYILGGASLALGGFMLLMEFLLALTFEGVRFIGWSLYPMSVMLFVGGVLIFLAICRPARDNVERKFFI